VDGDAKCALGHLKVCGDLSIGHGAFIGREKRFEAFEELRFVSGDGFIAETGDDAFEQGERPFAVVDAVGREIVGRVDLVAGVGALPVERKHGRTASAFLPAGLVPFVGEEVFQGGKEKGAEAAFFGAEAIEIIALQKFGEETLSEVFGVLASISATADVSVKWIPVIAAKFGEGFFRLRRGAAACGDDGRPMRGGEGIMPCRDGRRCVIGGQSVGKAVSCLSQHFFHFGTESVDPRLKFMDSICVVNCQSRVQFSHIRLLFED
jgi:hypothetical protein